MARLPSATPALPPASQAHEIPAAPASETPPSGRHAHIPVSLPGSLRPMLATWQGLTLPLVAGWDTWRSTTGPAAMPRPQGLRLQQERAEAVTADWVLRLQAWQDPALLMPLGLRPRLSQSPESGVLREVPQERDPLMPGRIQPEIRFGIQLRF